MLKISRVIIIKRIFLVVLDSLGIGEMPDADRFGDRGSNTLKTLYDSGRLNIPNLEKLGLFNICGNEYGKTHIDPTAAFARMTEQSNGKDTTLGHWEIAGIISPKSFPTYPNGFPDDIISEFERQTGRKVLCNKPYSGTEVILEYGRAHEQTGDLIVYTSGDSVFQIAAHEDIVSLDELYRYCDIARNMLKGKHNVGRVIARPFIGQYPNYKRTSNRHDYSVKPPRKTMLDYLSEKGFDVVSVGKIFDIFAGQGIKESHKTVSNDDGMVKTLEIIKKDFCGLCFVNLVDFDSSYGHRNDIKGYTDALNAFDKRLSELLDALSTDDILMITADHGCDPKTESTDHSREYTPLIIYGKNINPKDLGTRNSFADIGKTVLDIFEIENKLDGQSFANMILRGNL